jgi:hypothetical protein
MSTTTDQLGRHYPRLSVEERIRLVLLALARGDEAEVQRLSVLEPLREYRLRDRAFVFRGMALDNICRCLATDLQPWLGRLELIADLRDSDRWCGDMPIPKRAADVARDFLGRLDEALTELETHALTRLRVAWDAFAALCAAEVELEPEVVLRALHTDILEWLEPHREAMDALPEPDGPAEVEDRAQWRDAYRKAWQWWAEGRGGI